MPRVAVGLAHSSVPTYIQNEELSGLLTVRTDRTGSEPVKASSSQRLRELPESETQLLHLGTNTNA